MPCDGGGWPTGYTDHSQEIKGLQVLLCEVCQVLEDQGFDFTKRPTLWNWWTAHKAADKIRVERELAAAKQKADTEAALAKLTEYEKRLLRLK